MKKQKIKLDDLKVESFMTTDQSQVKAGVNTFYWVGYTVGYTYSMLAC